jgi:heavy metal translocating P-type ATPase
MITAPAGQTAGVFRKEQSLKFIIKHEIEGRLRVHIDKKRLTYKEADILYYYIHNLTYVVGVKVYERTSDVAISYVGDREFILQKLKAFRFDQVTVPEVILETSGRELNAKYKEKLIQKVVLRYLVKYLIPAPIRSFYTGIRSMKYTYKGIKSLLNARLEVSVLDATAIGISVIRNEMGTAGSIMFLLGIGEILEEWTHKKSVEDLARVMSLNVNKVWTLQNGQEILVPSESICPGDLIVIHMGSVIPFDGTIISGEAMVNQSALTGESEAVRKIKDGYVYAGTVIEEGEVTIEVKATSGTTRFEKIVKMIEDSEKLKSSVEGKAERLADKLVPYTLVGTALTYLFTRNVTKALSILMVDFSCALKLATPISVLSAIREAGLYNITVKGGKYLEAISEASTIVFDKTGTLTKAKPRVAKVVSLCGKSTDELLRIAACLEEHFPHSMAKAVVHAAKEKDLEHEEMHSKVEYIVAHGISTYIEEKRVLIGSHHFIFDDESCEIDTEYADEFEKLPIEYSHLYLAIDNKVAGVICIEDQLREEAEAVINSLKSLGIGKIVMMTGDSERTAAAIAKKVGIDEFYAEVLPEDKANYILKEKELGRKVIMVGDGINDSPALSVSDAGIAISDGAELAREIADITIAADDLFELVTLKLISNGLMQRISRNYKFIVGFNSVLLVLGMTGIIQPSTSSLLHNASTLWISVQSMNNLLEE